MDADDCKAGAIILKDLALFNRAAIFFETQIEPLIRTEIGQVVSSWLEAHNWSGESDVSEQLEDLWVAPRHWMAPEENESYAWFQFRYRANSDTSSYEIADLFGSGQADWGLRFEVGHGWFGGKTAWNAYAKGLVELGHQLNGRGWVHEGKGVFFRPVVLPADKLASAWENEDWVEALAPLRRALDTLVDDLQIFDVIVNGAKVKAEKAEAAVEH
ncbi:hypothetical protein EI613_32940 (plasmid) [Azospirillum sp. 412522]|nr:hypothetical protein [Azospirillum sp. 412522]MBY6266652.1 hypothetical protein [Azospirillum sp. 412522]